MEMLLQVLNHVIELWYPFGIVGKHSYNSAMGIPNCRRRKFLERTESFRIRFNGAIAFTISQNVGGFYRFHCLAFV